MIISVVAGAAAKVHMGEMSVAPALVLPLNRTQDDDEERPIFKMVMTNTHQYITDCHHHKGKGKIGPFAFNSLLRPLTPTPHKKAYFWAVIKESYAPFDPFTPLSKL